VEGFIVPTRDEAALADRMEELLSNRARARQYTWKEYKARLLAALGLRSEELEAQCSRTRMTEAARLQQQNGCPA
jgi:hypothetical protein